MKNKSGIIAQIRTGGGFAPPHQPLSPAYPAGLFLGDNSILLSATLNYSEPPPPIPGPLRSAR
jgi:hypothetical protein